MLCEYGCGQEAIHQFKNGKWCCSKRTCQCPNKIKNTKMRYENETQEEKIRRKEKQKLTHSTNEFKKNQSYKLKEYYKNDPDAREKNSCAVKKFFANETSEQKKERIIMQKESHSSLEYKKNAALKSKRELEITRNRYPIFAKEEELRYNPDKPTEEREIQVHCKNHNCENSKEKGGWFTPTSTQIWNRIADLESNKAQGGSYFYCSQYCKDTCPLYMSRGTDPFKKQPFRSQVWNDQVLKQDDSECQICGTKENLECHHIIPVKVNPEYAIDPSNGMVLCKVCHDKYGHKKGTECSYENLAKIVCNKNKKVNINQMESI